LEAGNRESYRRTQARIAERALVVAGGATHTQKGVPTDRNFAANLWGRGGLAGLQEVVMAEILSRLPTVQARLRNPLATSPFTVRRTFQRGCTQLQKVSS
jgi:hypothetical protein